jgi:uncharacterized membrane protein YfcA
MIFGLPANELLFLAVAILFAGAISGILAGLFGIGGSTIVIPVLYEFFRFLGVPDDVRMQLCVGTALAITVPTTFRAYLEHKKKGIINERALKLWAVPSVLGVMLGSVIAWLAPAAVFKTAFILFALFMSARFLLGRESWKIGDELPGKPVMMAAGVTFGTLATLVGVAGGSFSTLFLSFYGQAFQAALATSSGLGVLIGIPASIGYMIAGWPQQALMPPLTVGFVSLLGVILFSPASVLAAPYGARLAHRMSKRKLEISFGVFLLLIALRFGYSLIA